MAEQMTCGKGLAEHSALPLKTGELIRAVAEVLEVHMRALDQSDPNSRREHAAYQRLAHEHRLAGTQLTQLGHEMAGYRDLPMGRHDMEAMRAPAVRESFKRFVELEEELLLLLQRRISADREMLQGMAAAR
jgi:hypothetical protein